MKKKNLKNLRLRKTNISKLNTGTLQGGRGHSDHPCIADTDLGKPSLHCGTLGCESAGCITPFWTDSDCAVILG